MLETGTATSGFYLRIAIGLASLFTAIRSRGYFLDRLGDLFYCHYPPLSSFITGLFDIVFIITLKLTLEGQAFSLLLSLSEPHEEKNRYSIALLKNRILRKILLLALDLLETDTSKKTREIHYPNSA